jgi:hypothetical protein
MNYQLRFKLRHTSQYAVTSLGYFQLQSLVETILHGVIVNALFMHGDLYYSMRTVFYLKKKICAFGRSV